MLVIGLTGGIGSGKSTVTKMFAEMGTPIIDADVIAHELTRFGQPAYEKILAHFKDYAVTEKGILDRTKLRQYIFTHAAERAWLENLLHPLIRDEMVKKLQSLSAPYVILAIPLLLEVNSYPFIDRILVVHASKSHQLSRVMLRDKNTEQEINAILNAQISPEDRLQKAHDVIDNNGPPEALLPLVKKMHKFYLELSKNKDT